jgi:hypothetical protein
MSSITGKDNEFFILANGVQIRSGAYPPSYPVVIEESFPGNKAAMA